MKTFILIIKMGISTLIEYIPLEIWKYIYMLLFCLLKLIFTSLKVLTDSGVIEKSIEIDYTKIKMLLFLFQVLIKAEFEIIFHDYKQSFWSIFFLQNMIKT